MTREEEFIENLYDEANEKLKEIYKEQKENRDKLLKEIALIMLTYTVLDGLMAILRRDKTKTYKRLSKLINNATQSQASTQTHVINNILANTVKNTFSFYSYNHNLKDVKKIVDDNFKGKHFNKRVWENEKATGEHLHKQVKQFLDGKINVNKIKKDIEKAFNTNAYNAKRLTETEVARCSNNAFDRFCIETGVEKVRYNATLDNRLCNDCGQYHDKVFNFNNKIEVPRHPLCRCFYTIEDEEIIRKKDFKEYEDYKEVLEEIAPKTFDDFQDLKYNKLNEWNQRKNDFNIVNMYKVDFGNVPPRKILELDKLAFEAKTSRFDYKSFSGRDRKKIKNLGKSGNFAIMEFENKKYLAHSSVNEIEDIEFKSIKDNKSDFIIHKDDRAFETLIINGIPRHYCTEAKFFEYVNEFILKDYSGEITILSELDMCHSCRGVLRQFKEKYSNVKVNMVSGKEGVSWRKRK